MLVALPAAIAFGVTVFSAIGPAYAVHGALAGIVGTVAIGLVAAPLGGTDRLISAPCAPAAAVSRPSPSRWRSAATNRPSSSSLLLLVGGSRASSRWSSPAGRGPADQVHPVPGGQRLPHRGRPASSSCSQVPKLLGTPDGVAWWQALLCAGGWDWRAIAMGVVIGRRDDRRVRDWPRACRARSWASCAGVGRLLRARRGGSGLRTLAGNALVHRTAGRPGDGFLDAIARCAGTRSAALGPVHAGGLARARSRWPRCCRSTRSRPASCSTS